MSSTAGSRQSSDLTMGLELRDLSKHFTVKTDRGRATVRGVEKVNLEIPEGQTR